MKRVSIRVSESDHQTLVHLAAKQSGTVSDVIRGFILQAEKEKNAPVSDLKIRLETAEKTLYELSIQPQKADQPEAQNDQSEALQETQDRLQNQEEEIDRHRDVFQQLLTVMLLILPSDKKPFARKAAELLNLEL